MTTREEPARQIICIECGGTAHLLWHPDPDEDPRDAPEVLAYRCEDCLERMDVTAIAE